MVTKADIQNFLQPRRFAIAGVSRNPKKFGRMVYNELKKSGYTLYPINPNLQEIEGEKCLSGRRRSSRRCKTPFYCNGQKGYG